MDIISITMTPDRRLSRADAARYLGIAKKTLCNWACRGLGPRSVKVGGKRFYYLADLASFVGES